MQIAIVVGEGVLDDECEAFRSILAHVPRSVIVQVAARLGEASGPGGTQLVDATFDEVSHPDVVVVPGGLGCRRTANDPHIRSWLAAVAPGCRWLVASSTGVVVLAAAGVLDGHRAVTHWLAAELLARHPGVDVVSGRSSVRSGRIVTCTGRVSAHEVALTVLHELGGSVPQPPPILRHKVSEPLMIELSPVDARPDRRRSRHTPN